MNELLDRARAWLNGRTPRERWILVAGACVVVGMIVWAAIVSPLETRAASAEARYSALAGDVQRAQVLAREVRRIQGDLDAVKARIKPGEKTNLLALLESLAGEARIDKDQLESIDRKAGAENAEFPETKYQVSLRGVDLQQTVTFLEKISSSPAYLIIRQLTIQKRAGRKKGEATLNVDFEVSSFERA